MNALNAGVVVLDGSSLKVTDVARVARQPEVKVELAAAGLARVREGRKVIDRIVSDYRRALKEGTEPPRVYGVTTGFGEFKDVDIDPAELEVLQRNLILSHAVGTGDGRSPDDPANCFPPDVVRAALLLRLNAFLKGHSGVRVELVFTLAAMINGGVVPYVPQKGSVGSSGDLCPLAHLFLPLVGEGRYRLFRTREDVALRKPSARKDFQAKDLARHLAPEFRRLGAPRGMKPATPRHKEGLALTNGANFSAALLALGVHDAQNLMLVADIAAAMTIEATCSHLRALDSKVHQARNLPGQMASAEDLRALLHGSKLVDRAKTPQDPYSVRCAPQVHGASRDAIAYACMVAEAEINAATDNPLFFDGEVPLDFQAHPLRVPGRDRHAYSAGNFHGQPVAIAADVLAIATSELANISERRTQMLLDQHHNRHLPANLIAKPGLNSGFMIAQYCAASLVSENKVLSHPASVDSIPTSANSEDHVAMATLASRKLQTVISNVEAVLAIELMVASQAAEWRVLQGMDPNTPPRQLKDRVRAAEKRQKAFSAFVRQSPVPGVVALLGAGTRRAYAAVRGVVPALVEDRILAGDLASLRALVGSGQLATSVALALAEVGLAHAPSPALTQDRPWLPLARLLATAAPAEEALGVSAMEERLARLSETSIEILHRYGPGGEIRAACVLSFEPPVDLPKLPGVQSHPFVLAELAVHPNHRRQGHGTSLVLHVQALAREHRRSIIAEVSRARKDLLAILDALGFQVVRGPRGSRATWMLWVPESEATRTAAAVR